MTIRDATIGSPVQQVPINCTGPGDQIIVSAQLGFRIQILQFFFVTSANVTIVYKSGSGTQLTGPMPFLANGAQVQDFIQLPLTCNVNDPFVINLGGVATLGGTLWYVQVPQVHE